ncbi:MAG: hypothetical protein ACKVQK_06605 [Burkholderiales bacterium]
MINFLRAPSDRLIIDNGRVFCPAQSKDVDIDRCGACRSVREFNLDANPAYMRCHSEALPGPQGIYHLY